MLSNWTEFIRLNRNESCKPTDLKKGNYMQWPVLFYCAERFVTRESWIYCHCDIFRPIRNVYILSNQENDNNRKEKYILNSLYINRNTHWCIIFVYDYNHHFFVICFDDECSYQAISSLFTALYTYFSTY